MSWKLDPLPFSVPLRPLDDEPPLVVLDEVQAVSDKAIAARAAPAITTPWLRTRCMLNIPSQLPAEYCGEGDLDGVAAAWPKIMLAAGPKALPITSRPVARLAGSIISRPAVELGSWDAGRRSRRLTRGLLPRCRDRASLAVPAARGLTLLSCFSPIPATHPPFSGAFTGDYQRGRRSFTISNYGRPARGQPRVF